MPTWGTVLSPNQVEDLVALINTWRLGEAVRPSFDVTQLLDSAIFSLENDDPGSALLQIQRSLASTQGPAQEILLNVEAQLQSGDNTGALATVKALRQQWPMGDATNGAVVYAKNCAPCHGPNGEGGIGKQLSPNEFIQSLTNAEIVQFLNEGRAGTAMAGFKDRLDDTQLADVTTFMRLWQP
jgi:mono/diheme cytochrome c family protein